MSDESDQDIPSIHVFHGTVLGAFEACLQALAEFARDTIVEYVFLAFPGDAFDGADTGGGSGHEALAALGRHFLDGNFPFGDLDAFGTGKFDDGRTGNATTTGIYQKRIGVLGQR